MAWPIRTHRVHHLTRKNECRHAHLSICCLSLTESVRMSFWSGGRQCILSSSMAFTQREDVKQGRHRFFAKVTFTQLQCCHKRSWN